MTIVNFGYEKKIITPDELLSLKEEPFVIFLRRSTLEILLDTTR